MWGQEEVYGVIVAGATGAVAAAPRAADRVRVGAAERAGGRGGAAHAAAAARRAAAPPRHRAGGRAAAAERRAVSTQPSYLQRGHFTNADATYVNLQAFALMYFPDVLNKTGESTHPCLTPVTNKNFLNNLGGSLAAVVV